MIIPSKQRLSRSKHATQTQLSEGRSAPSPPCALHYRNSGDSTAYKIPHGPDRSRWPRTSKLCSDTDPTPTFPKAKAQCGSEKTGLQTQAGTKTGWTPHARMKSSSFQGNFNLGSDRSEESHSEQMSDCRRPSREAGWVPQKPRSRTTDGGQGEERYEGETDEQRGSGP